MYTLLLSSHIMTYRKVTTIICLNFGTPKIINYPFVPNYLGMLKLFGLYSSYLNLIKWLCYTTVYLFTYKTGVEFGDGCLFLKQP